MFQSKALQALGGAAATFWGDEDCTESPQPRYVTAIRAFSEEEEESPKLWSPQSRGKRGHWGHLERKREIPAGVFPKKTKKKNQRLRFQIRDRRVSCVEYRITVLGDCETATLERDPQSTKHKVSLSLCEAVSSRESLVSKLQRDTGHCVSPHTVCVSPSVHRLESRISRRDESLESLESLERESQRPVARLFGDLETSSWLGIQRNRPFGYRFETTKGRAPVLARARKGLPRPNLWLSVCVKINTSSTGLVGRALLV